MSGRRKVVGYTSQYSVRNVRLLQSHNSISCEIKYTIGYISKYNLLLKKTKMGQDIGYRKISINIYIENIGFFFFCISGIQTQEFYPIINFFIYIVKLIGNQKLILHYLVVQRASLSWNHHIFKVKIFIYHTIKNHFTFNVFLLFFNEVLGYTIKLVF